MGIGTALAGILAAKQMRYWYFLGLLFFLSLLTALTACGQATDDLSQTAVVPALTTTLTPSTSSQGLVGEQATITPPPVATPAATVTPAVEQTLGLAATAGQEGALIRVSMSSQVGVLLDEFPVEMRDRVATAILAQSADIWRARASRQVRLSRLRLNFRNFNYPDKKQLPLPPPQLWSIRLDPAGPIRQTIQGHDLVTIGYTFTSTLLTDAHSPGQSEPALAGVGGIWEEPFIFPADPDFLLQRTANACINEGGFPPDSFDSENAWHFYDFDCEADSGGALGCHRTSLPKFSCREALAATVGEVETALRFERLPWDETLAAQVRIGPVTSPDTPDLMVVGDDLETNRIIYRYIEPDDCALEEGAVGGGGWRRLLQFNATVHNVGGQALHVGPVVAEDPVNHVFDYSTCHDHFHYSNYGDFFLQELDQLTGSKQAFCVQSTSRLSNNETAPLTHDYSCRFQGIQAGWVDEYIAGLDAQWIDITGLEVSPAGQTVQLGFSSNSDGFLCEGTAVVDENGETVWEPSEFTTEEGQVINRPQCNFMPGWEGNNREVRDVIVPQTGSFVTAPCRDGEVGPLRNCGFSELTLADADLTCQPGEPVTWNLRVMDEGAPQVLRVCEWSAVLGTGVACTYEEALANTVLHSELNNIAFTCPGVRDAGAEDPSGGYALYTAPVWPQDNAAPVRLESEE